MSHKLLLNFFDLFFKRFLNLVYRKWPSSRLFWSGCQYFFTTHKLPSWKIWWCQNRWRHKPELVCSPKCWLELTLAVKELRQSILASLCPSPALGFSGPPSCGIFKTNYQNLLQNCSLIVITPLATFVCENTIKKKRPDGATSEYNRTKLNTNLKDIVNHLKSSAWRRACQTVCHNHS